MATQAQRQAAIDRAVEQVRDGDGFMRRARPLEEDMGKPRPAKIRIAMKNDKGHACGYVDITAMLDHQTIDRLVSETPTGIELLRFNSVHDTDRDLLPMADPGDPPDEIVP